MFGNLLREWGVNPFGNGAECACKPDYHFLRDYNSNPDAGGKFSIRKRFNTGTRAFAFLFDIAGGVLFAKFLNLFLKNKGQPP